MTAAVESRSQTAAPAPRDRLPSLDGLRALAISLVLLDHLGRYRLDAHSPFRPLVERGGLGVQLFFVLSGFLITRLLVKELESTSRIHLGSFYVRRAFRILPAFYGYVLFALLLQAVGRVLLDGPSILHALTFTSNFQRWNGDWWFGHTWSLSVEEQFYLVWPIVFALVGPRRALGAALAVLVICPGLRLAGIALDPQSTEALQWSTPFVGDAIATGCATALLLPRLTNVPRVARLFDHRAAPLVAAALLSLDLAGPAPKPLWFASYTLVNLGAALLMVHAIRGRSGPLFALLNHRAIVAIGLGSYSIYLWQQLFLNTYTGFGPWTEPPLSLLATLAFAACSYRFVERPFLALRRRLFPDRALLARPSVE